MAETRGCGCPRCGGHRLIRGRLSGGPNEYGRARFRPVKTRGSTRWLVPPWGGCVDVARESEVCLDCGLLWSSVEPEKAAAVVRRFGSEGLVHRLGLAAKKPLPGPDDLA